MCGEPIAILCRQRLKGKCIFLHGTALYLQAAEEFLWLKEKRYSGGSPRGPWFSSCVQRPAKPAAAKAPIRARGPKPSYSASLPAGRSVSGSSPRRDRGVSVPVPCGPAFSAILCRPTQAPRKSLPVGPRNLLENPRKPAACRRWQAMRAELIAKGPLDFVTLYSTLHANCSIIAL